MALPHLTMGGTGIDVVGLSLRLPQSTSASQLWNHLLEGRDMITESRWPGLYGAPLRAGVVPDFHVFDAPFFAVHGKQSQRMDPQMKKLLEVGYEAWIDSGIDFKALAGLDRVGVYVGTPFGADALSLMTADPSEMTGYEIAGVEPSLFASRLAWWFNFKGPCKMIGTALDNAVDELMSGRIDYAMVGGSSAILDPNFTSAFVKFGMLSPEGQCRSFDAGGHGYVRSDGVVVVIIARSGINAPRWVSQPPLCHILGIMTNNDGYTKEGITFPSGEAQAELSTQVLAKAGVDPTEVVYLEAHGTGTVAGDGQELGSIEAVYGYRRTSSNPLLIGSVKSNLGHTEAASGLAGLAKIALAYEYGVLPANLHFQAPNPHSVGLSRGSLKVVTENVLFPGGIVAINNFGAGGSNVHLLVQGEHVQQPAGCHRNAGANGHMPLEDLPLPLASRTVEGIRRLAEVISQVPGAFTVYRDALTGAANKMFKDLVTHPVRGTIIPGSQDLSFRHLTTRTHPPVWFVFSGNGSQWAGMAADLMDDNHMFCQRVKECAAVLEHHYAFDLLSQFKRGYSSGGAVEASVGLTALQIGLVDVLDQEFGIRPAGFLGHSAGEIVCGYVDGALTLDQTIRIAYERAMRSAESAQGGLMASVGLAAAVAEERISALGAVGTVVACDNSPCNVTLSGPELELQRIIDALSAEGIFVRTVDSRGLAYHSPALDTAVPALQGALESLIPYPLQRSKKWVSTTFAPEHEADLSADYHVHGFRHCCLFRQACSAIPEGAVLVEVGPHNILRSLIRQSRPDLVQVPIMQKGHNAQATMHAAVSELWKHGVDFTWSTTSGPPALRLPRELKEALVAWDHGTKTHLPVRPKAQSAAFTRTFNLAEKDAFLQGHVVDNRIVIPGAAYIVTAWEAVAAAKGVPMDRLPVTFKDVSILQAVHADIDTPVTLAVTLDKSNGFQVLCGPDLIAEGKVHEGQPLPPNNSKHENGALYTHPWTYASEETIPSKELYKDISRTGINYDERFRTILQASSDGRAALIRWDGEFIAFLDGLVQAAIFTNIPDEYVLRMPVRFRRVDIINPAPSLAVGEAVSMEIEPACKSGWTSIATMEGVGLAQSPRRPSDAVTRILRRTWVPYGQQLPLSETPERAAKALKVQEVVLSIMGEHLLPELQHREADGSIAPHHAKVLRILSQLDIKRLPLEEIEDVVDEPDCIWARMVLDLLGTPEAVDKTLQAPIQAIVTHPEHDILYLEDIMFGGFSKSELQVLVDTFITNAPPAGYMVCEIGAGTGGLTRALVPMLYGSVLPTPMICYVATDVTPAFGPSLLESVPFPQVNFQVWDCNKKAPEAVGSGFNLVVASNAIHTCDDMATTLKHAYDILADGGFLMCYEAIGPLCSGFWGLDESCWRFTDEREYSLWMKSDTWMRILTEAGFAIITVFKDQAESRMMFLARKVSPPSLRVHYLLEGPKEEMTRPEFDAWRNEATGHLAEGTAMVEELAHGFSGKAAAPHDIMCPTRVYLHGTKSSSPGLIGLIPTVRQEPQGEKIRCLYALDDCMNAEHMLEAAAPHDLVYNIFKGGVCGAYFHLPTDVDELICVSDVDSVLPGGKAMAIGTPGNLSTLHWEPVIAPSPEDGWNIPCTVDCCALNFKDVLLAFGKLPIDLMGDCNLGLEFAGRLECPAALGGIKYPAGTRVMGLARCCIATKVYGHEYSLWPIPEGWSMADASTTICVYFTVYYGLIHRAGLEEGSTVLIHSGAGGVGLAAIQICLNRQCRVLVTVGSEDRKEFLLKKFPQLHADDVGDSRSTSFERMVMQQTGGRGVNFVLNSLDQDKLQASVRCLSTFGTLVEIGKADMVAGSQLPMRPMLKAITYLATDIWMLYAYGHKAIHLREVRKAYKILSAGLASGEVQPLPYRVFGSEHVGSAMRYLTKGTHIGKAVIAMQTQHGADNGEHRGQGLANGHALERVVDIEHHHHFTLADNHVLPSVPSNGRMTRSECCHGHALHNRLEHGRAPHDVLSNGSVALNEESSSHAPGGDFGRKGGIGAGLDKGYCNGLTPPLVKLTWSARPGTTYIITGGLGGFGLALGSFLVKRGVTHLVVTSKRGVRHGFQQRVINSWREAGAQVMLSTLDVSDMAATQQLVSVASSMAPVGGIFHLAMVLNDSLLINMSAKEWRETVSVKAAGACNLDAASRGQPLDTFVVFSTFMSYRGMQGQSNYTYGSECAQVIVEDRRAAGLPGLAIQWGTVGNVGWMVDHEREAAMLISHKVHQQPIDDCLATLGALLAGPPEKVPPVTTVFAQPPHQGGQVTRNKQDLVTKVLGIMGLREDETASYSLAQMGIDSMQSVEVRAAIQTALCKPFPMGEVGALTIADLRKMEEESAGLHSINGRTELGTAEPALPLSQGLDKGRARRHEE